MENPYARPAGSSSAPAPSGPALTPEQQRVADYELAIGRNTGYYLPKFEAFDRGGSSAGWHWPAFFVTTPWYLYRKMYLWGLLNLAYPYFALIVFSILVAALNPPAAVTGVLAVIVFGAPSVLLSVFANALYWRYITKVIHNMPPSIAQQPDKRARRIEREGGTGLGVMLGIVLGGGVFVMGILAAIAIPAYQDYVIRAQVAEGLSMAAPIKVEVAEFYLQNQRWPDQTDLGDERSGGKYVRTIGVAAGSVVITYGNAASPKLEDLRLILTPALDMQDQISWICGDGNVEPGVRRADGPYGSDLPDKYLPRDCRTPR